MFGTLAEKRKFVGKIVSIKEARAAAHVARKNATRKQAKVKTTASSTQQYDQWLKDTLRQLKTNYQTLKRTVD
jgi:hypothetical protein